MILKVIKKNNGIRSEREREQRWRDMVGEKEGKREGEQRVIRGTGVACLNKTQTLN